jgi:hypothetical protein
MTGNRGRWPKIDEEGGVEAVTLLILEWLGEQGVDAMIRMDAERLADNAPAWTFAASGGPLAHGMRADGGLFSSACPLLWPACVTPVCRFRSDLRPPSLELASKNSVESI